MAIEVGDLLGGRCAADVEQQAAAADGEFVGDDLGFGRQQRGPMRSLAGISRAGFERIGRDVECFSRRQYDCFRGERTAGDLADGLLPMPALIAVRKSCAKVLA